MLRLRSSLLVSFLLILPFGLFPVASTAQSANSVVEAMEKKYEQQMESVDNYVVETNLYTSYNKKEMQNGKSILRTQTEMKGQGASSFASTSTPSLAYGMQFEKLKQHATVAGRETVNGVRAHVLEVDDPSEVDPEMGKNAKSLTYYVDAERSVLVRMVMERREPAQKRRGGGGKDPSVTVDMKNYETVDGLTLPHLVETTVEMNMSEKERKKMKMIMDKMETMPEQQREQMKQMMGGQMEMMKQMMSGEPIVVEVQSVRVNVDLPEGTF